MKIKWNLKTPREGRKKRSEREGESVTKRKEL